MKHTTIEVPPDLSGERADKVIASCLGLSRSEARSIVDAGDAVVGDRKIKASDKLHVGTSVAVTVPEVDTALLPDATVAFDVRYEDDYLVVVDKPIGVIVHPGSGRSSGNTCQRVTGAISRDRGSWRRRSLRHRSPTGQGHIGPARRRKNTRGP